MFWLFFGSLLMWANSDDGRFTIGTCWPQVYSRERAMEELTRQLEEDGTLEELKQMRKEWEAFWGPFEPSNNAVHPQQVPGPPEKSSQDDSR